MATLKRVIKLSKPVRCIGILQTTWPLSSTLLQGLFYFGGSGWSLPSHKEDRVWTQSWGEVGSSSRLWWLAADQWSGTERMLF